MKRNQPTPPSSPLLLRTTLPTTENHHIAPYRSEWPLRPSYSRRWQARRLSRCCFCSGRPAPSNPWTQRAYPLRCRRRWPMCRARLVPSRRPRQRSSRVPHSYLSRSRSRRRLRGHPGAAPPTHRPRDRRSAWRPKRASRSRTCHHNKVDRTRVICFPESACPDRYDARARRISSSPRRPRRRCRSRARRSHRAPGLVPTTDRAPPNRPTAVPTCIRTRTVAVSCSANGRYRSFYGHHR